MTQLGYVDDLIAHVDAGKKVFHVFDPKNKANSMQHRKMPHLASTLATLPKFRVPALGTFYRPVEDLKEYAADKFTSYALNYELAALQYPPYDEFVVEFNGYDERTDINKITIIDKYIIHCKAVQKLDQPAIRIDTYYHVLDDAASAGLRLVFPKGWTYQGTPCYLMSKGVQSSPRDGKNAWSPPLGYDIDPRSGWTDQNYQDMLTGMHMETRAIYQLMVVLNAKAGIVATNVKSCPAKKKTFTGRPLGYEYKVLDIHPDYVAESGHAQGTGEGGHKRFHWRRAHLRHYKNGDVTFVRQHSVGDPLLGTIEKAYRVHPA